MATDRDILERLDAHIESMDAYVARIDRHMERGNEHMERGNELVGDMRQFMRELILRVERTGRDQWRELSRMNDELERQGEEGRAHTMALLRMIDRMDRLDPPPQAA